MPRNSITRREFAEKVIAALHTEGATGEYVFDELENALTSPDRPPFSLEENYLEAQGQASYLLEQLVRAYAHIHLHPPEVPAMWEVATKVVFPYVRPMAFHAHRGFRAAQGQKLDPVPFGLVSEHVTVCVGVPSKWKTLVATVEDLKRWGVSIDEALEQARQNVSARGNPEWQVSNEYPGVYRSPWKDEYGISRILFPSVFGRVPLRGDPVIIAPTWQGFLVAGSDDEHGLVNLGRIGKKLIENDSYLIYRPMRARGDTLEHWVPPKGHPAHGPLRFLHLINECGDYVEQAQVGKRFFERREEASNIPSPQVYSSDGGREFGTIVTWRDGPPCALPKADCVAFKRKSENLGVAKWADVQRVIGSELEPMKTYPPRWLGRTFPADWQLSSMNVVSWGPGGA
jgi:hypothetical protein